MPLVRLCAALLIGTCVSASGLRAQTAERFLVDGCVEWHAKNLETLQDNLADLAKLIVGSMCAEPISELFQAMSENEGVSLTASTMESFERQMEEKAGRILVETRAKRLGIEL